MKAAKSHLSGPAFLNILAGSFCVAALVNELTGNGSAALVAGFAVANLAFALVGSR